MESAELVSCLPYWGMLTEREKEFVKQNTVAAAYAKGAFLKGGSASCLGMLYVLSGSVRALMLSEEGREITLFRLTKGDSCVLSASCVLSQLRFETQMVALEDTRVLVVNAGAYANLMVQNLNVKCFSYELAAERSSAVIWVLQEILFQRFDRRLASFLLSYSEKTGSPEIRMTQEEIAREVNSAREVVARMLKQFSMDGLIELRRGSILIKNRSALNKL